MPEPAQRPAQPPRKEPTAEETQRAESAAEKLRHLVAGGMTRTSAAHRLHVPVKAVDRVLDRVSAAPGAADPPPAFPHETPDWYAGSPTPPAPVMAGSPSEDLQRIMGLFGIPRNIATGVAERFAFAQPDDVQALEKFLLDAGVAAPAARSVVGLYEQRAAAMGSATGSASQDRDDDSPRARLREMRKERLETLDLKMYEAQVRIAERESLGLAPSGGAPSAEAVSLRDQVVALTKTIEDLKRENIPTPRERELAGMVEVLREEKRNTEIAGVRRDSDEKIAALRQELTHRARTIDDVGVDSLAKSESIKYDAQGKLMGTLTNRVDRAPSLAQLAAMPRGAKALGLLDRRFDQVVGADGPVGLGVVPTDAEMSEAAATLEAAASGPDRPPLPGDRPRATVPRFGGRPASEPADDSGIRVA